MQDLFLNSLLKNNKIVRFRDILLRKTAIHLKHAFCYYQPSLYGSLKSESPPQPNNAFIQKAQLTLQQLILRHQVCLLEWKEKRRRERITNLHIIWYIFCITFPPSPHIFHPSKQILSYKQNMAYVKSHNQTLQSFSKLNNHCSF